MTEDTTSPGFVGTIVETVKTVVYALLIAGVFRSLLFQPFWIPTGSMKDTLLVGDFLFVNKMSYGYSYASCPSLRIPAMGIDIDAEDICGMFKNDNKRLFGSMPERGDVIVFRHPVTGADYIKRLIGLPGDRVQMKDGVLYINDVAAEQVPDGVFTELNLPQGPARSAVLCSTPTPAGAPCDKQRFIETLPGGKQHAILNATNLPPLDNTGVFTVPEGYFFFMGDNRDNSTDSRVAQARRGVGFVPYDALLGRADRVIFSSAGRSMLAFWDWRGDRFFKAIE